MDETKKVQDKDTFDNRRPGAIGSKESSFANGRDYDREAEVLLQDQIEKILNDVTNKLPPEIVSKLDITGNIRSKVHNYVNQNIANMFNQYVSFSEDELLKKTNNFITNEEKKALSKTPYQPISELLEKLNDSTQDLSIQFLENAVVNTYGSLKSKIDQNVHNIESQLINILDGETNINTFLKGSSTSNILKCAFKDDRLKPNNVIHCKLSINILDDELVSPIYQYQIGMDFIINNMIASHIQEQIEKEVRKLNTELQSEDQQKLDYIQRILEKINRVENYTDDLALDEKSKRYAVINKNLIDKVSEDSLDYDSDSVDHLSIRENIKRLIDSDDIRNRGYNSAVKNILTIINNQKIQYQFSENLKNARSFILKEYEEQDRNQLPDECFEIRLKYYSLDELQMMRDAYEKQIREFENEINKVYDVILVVYQLKKRYRTIYDFEDLYKNVYRDIKKMKQHDPYDIESGSSGEFKVWEEIMFVKPELSIYERSFNPMIYEKEYIEKGIIRVKKLIKQAFGNQNPIERKTIEERLQFLQNKFDDFTFQINPYHIQPGLVLEIDISSIKNKKITLKKMSNILGEFLQVISKDFVEVFPTK